MNPQFYCCSGRRLIVVLLSWRNAGSLRAKTTGSCSPWYVCTTNRSGGNGLRAHFQRVTDFREVYSSKSLGMRTYLFQLKTQKPSTAYNQLRRPGGLAGYPRARYTCRSISWVRLPPSAYSYKFVGTFSCAQIDSRKARKRELATFDESRRAVGMLNPTQDKNWRHVPGGEQGRHLRPPLVQNLESKSETEKKGKKRRKNSLLQNRK